MVVAKMGYIALETLLSKTGNSVYKLVVLASKRALELAEGRPSLTEAPLSWKPAAVALKEIVEGKIQYKA
jgi:DNA-directed RNA polymerase omega subunit